MPHNKSLLNQVAKYWANGKPLEAGRLVYESLSPYSRPRWASRILKVVIDQTGIRSPLFDQVLAVAEHQDMWNTGHQVFSILRDSTLRLDEKRRKSGLSEDEQLLATVLSLAEFVAKVIYNATYPSDEFDENSGWWVVAYLRSFVDKTSGDERFADSAWSALCTCE